MTVHQVKPEYERIVAAIPHCVGDVSRIAHNERSGVKAASDKWTDWYTDELFGLQMHGVEVVKAKLSRMECDCERLEGEPDRLNRFALEIADAEERKRALQYETLERNALLAEWYRYRSEVLLAASGRPSIIVDCHSFPSEVAPDVDICLGFNEDSSKPREQTIESVANIFRNAGYSVALNRPYANALAPTDYVGHSLMIEVNKRTYMNEATLEKTKGFGILRATIELVYRELLWNLYHLPECFRSWDGYPCSASDEEKRVAWEEIKRKIVTYVAERYGLPVPKDLSDTPQLDARRKEFRRVGRSYNSLAACWASCTSW